MNRKLVGAFLAAMIATASVSVFAAGGRTIEVFDTVKQVVVNKIAKPFDKNNAPFSYNGTTYVPLRFVADALGQPVEWDGKTGTIFIGETDNKNASYFAKDLKHMKYSGHVDYSYGNPKIIATSNTNIDYSNFLTLTVITAGSNSAEIEFPLNGQFETFSATLGVTNRDMFNKGSVMFKVYLDDKEVYAKKMKHGDMPENFSLNLKGANKIRFESINKDSYSRPFTANDVIEVGLFDGEFLK